MPRGSNGYVPWPSLRALQRSRRGCIAWGRFGLHSSYCCTVVCCLCGERAYCRAKGFAARVRSQLATCVVTLVQTSRTHQCCSFAPRWMVSAHTLAVCGRFSSVFVQPPIQLRQLPIRVLAVVLDSCTLGFLPSYACDVSMRKRIHVVRHYFGSDIRHCLRFELLAAVGCGLFPGCNGSNFASCDSE